MPKRSLNPGNNDTKQIEQLNKAVEAMLSRADGKAPKVAAGIEPLLRIAADLRDLPRDGFQGPIEIRIGREKSYVYRCRARCCCPHDSIAQISVPRSGQSD